MKQFTLAEKQQILLKLFKGTNERYKSLTTQKEQSEVSHIEQEIDNL